MHKYSLRNIFIISVIQLSSNPSTYKLFILVFYCSCKIGTFHAWSNGTSKYLICFFTKILLRSDRFTKRLFPKENKFLPRTVLTAEHFLNVSSC